MLITAAYRHATPVRCQRRSAMPLGNVTTHKHDVQQASVIAAPVTTSPFVYGPHAGLLRAGVRPCVLSVLLRCATHCANAAADAADAAASDADATRLYRDPYALLWCADVRLIRTMLGRITVSDARSCCNGMNDSAACCRSTNHLLFHDQSTACLEIKCAIFVFTIPSIIG